MIPTLNWSAKRRVAPGGDPQYTWSWSPIDKLTGHDTATPTFAVPSDVERHTTYSYTATATAEDADDGTAVVTVKVRDLGLLACNDSEAYEATADFTLDCSVRNEPAGATYMWTARGSTTDTGLLVGGTDGPTPTFAVPVDIGEPSGADKHYYYTATIMVGGVEEEREDVTVTILEKPDISICGQRSYYGEAFEVSAGARVVLPYEDCPEGVRGAPGPNPVYTYAWSIYGSTPESALAYVPPSNMTAWGSIVFHAPADEVLSSTTFTYKLAVSAENADDAEYDFWAVVTPTLVKIAVACEESSYEVDEGAADFSFACSASGAGDDSGEVRVVVVAARQPDGSRHGYAHIRCACRCRAGNDLCVHGNGYGGGCEERLGRGYGDGQRHECAGSCYHLQ